MKFKHIVLTLCLFTLAGEQAWSMPAPKGVKGSKAGHVSSESDDVDEVTNSKDHKDESQKIQPPKKQTKDKPGRCSFGRVMKVTLLGGVSAVVYWFREGIADAWSNSVSEIDDLSKSFNKLSLNETSFDPDSRDWAVCLGDYNVSNSDAVAVIDPGYFVRAKEMVGLGKSLEEKEKIREAVVLCEKKVPKKGSVGVVATTNFLTDIFFPIRGYTTPPTTITWAQDLDASCNDIKYLIAKRTTGVKTSCTLQKVWDLNCSPPPTSTFLDPDGPNLSPAICTTITNWQQYYFMGIGEIFEPLGGNLDAYLRHTQLCMVMDAATSSGSWCTATGINSNTICGVSGGVYDTYCGAGSDPIILPTGMLGAGNDSFDRKELQHLMALLKKKIKTIPTIFNPYDENFFHKALTQKDHEDIKKERSVYRKTMNKSDL